MLSFERGRWNYAGFGSFVRKSATVVATSWCMIVACENTPAQQSSRPVNNQLIQRAGTQNSVVQTNGVPNTSGTTNRTAPRQSNPANQVARSNQPVPPAKPVAGWQKMEPVPDFWENNSTMDAYLKATDRLDRKNLPMLYHFSYDPPFQTHKQGPMLSSPGFPPSATPLAAPMPLSAPGPQSQNNGYADLNERLSVLMGDVNGIRRTSAPIPPVSDSSVYSISPKPALAPRSRAVSSEIYSVPTLSQGVTGDEQFEKVSDVFPTRLIL